MADTKVSALTAASALAGTETIPAVQAGATVKATVTQIGTRVQTQLAATAANAKDTTNVTTLLTPGNLLNVQANRLLWTLAADMNTTADQAFTKVGTFTSFVIQAARLWSPSVSLTTAAGGIYSAASKGGDALVANTQVYTGASVASAGVALSLTALGFGLRSDSAVYLSLTTAQGAPATAVIGVYGWPIT